MVSTLEPSSSPSFGGPRTWPEIRIATSRWAFRIFSREIWGGLQQAFGVYVAYTRAFTIAI